MSTTDRRAELERKKAKLQAIRDEKKRKEEEKKKKESDSVAAAQTATAGLQQDIRMETEQMLADLGIPPSGAGMMAAPRPRTLVPSDPAPTTAQAIGRRNKVTLTTSQVTQTNIPPKELVSYSKETQTILVEREAPAAEARSRAERTSTQDDDTDSLEVGVDTPPMSAHKLSQPEIAQQADTGEEVAKPEPVAPPVHELSEEDKMKICQREDFQRFLDRSARILERAITEGADILMEYAGDDDQGESAIGEGEKLQLHRQFYDERWSKHRTITSLDWSTQHPELLVASYNNNEDSPHEPDGIALIWNQKFKKDTPEYVFHCQSAVMSACFAKFHPNLVVGGTYSGQIVLWDNRSNKKTPVQRTPLSASAHTHPVYCVNVVGTQNAHNLISVSNDGKMCSWNLDMLSQPQDCMELQHKQSRAAAVTCFSFLSGDVNNFVVGSEETSVYTASRHGSKAGINDIFEGHQGPVTGIDCHTVPGQIDFSPYFLTSSFDWTVKLWSIKENKPLHSFEDNGDYVFDARWSPIHPALFATVDGMGRLDLWNLNTDTEVPAATTMVDTNIAMNKCRWHQSGLNIAVGDDIGRIHIYDVGESLAQPKPDDWPKFVHTLQELQTTKAEQEEEAIQFGQSPLR